MARERGKVELKRITDVMKSEDGNGIRWRVLCREIDFRTQRKKRNGVEIGSIL